VIIRYSTLHDTTLEAADQRAAIVAAIIGGRLASCSVAFCSYRHRGPGSRSRTQRLGPSGGPHLPTPRTQERCLRRERSGFRTPPVTIDPGKSRRVAELGPAGPAARRSRYGIFAYRLRRRPPRRAPHI